MEENTAQVEGESTQIQARDHVEQRVYAFPAGDSVPVDEINVFDLWRKVWARKKFVSRVSSWRRSPWGGCRS